MTNKLRKKKRGSDVPLEALSLIMRLCWPSSSRLTVDDMVGVLLDKGYEIGRSTVGKWMKKFNEAPEQVKRAESEFHWHQLDQTDIPWESSSLVLQCKKVLESYVDQSPESQLSELRAKPLFGFTNRDARWCWRVRGAAPSLSPHEVLSIATQYAQHERLTDLVAFGLINRIGTLPLDAGDSLVGFLDGLLTYQPWSSDEDRREFVSAIPDRIPFPSESLTWATWAYCLGAPAPEKFPFTWESPRQLSSMPPPSLHNTKEWFRDMEANWGATVPPG